MFSKFMIILQKKKSLHSEFPTSIHKNSEFHSIMQLKSIAITILFLFGTVFIFSQTPKKAMKNAKAAVKLKQYEQAIPFLSEAITLKPTLLEAYVLRAKSYEAINQKLNAANDYIKASDLKPDKVQFPFEAGRLLAGLEMYIEAIHVLNKAIQLKKSLLPAYLLKYQCLVSLKNYKEALAVSELALEVKKTAENYYLHGKASEKLNNDLAAEEDYRKAIKVDKNFKYAYVSLAEVLLRQNKSDEALKFCSTIVGLYPEYAEAYRCRSVIYHTKSDLINALGDINKAIELEPIQHSYYELRATLNTEYKQYELAASDYSKLIIWDSKNFPALYKRAMLYEKLNKNDKAISDYSEFLKLSDKNPEYKDWIEKATQRIYDLNAEKDKPEIEIALSKGGNSKGIEIPLSSKSYSLKGMVTDQNRLEFIKVNDIEIEYNRSENSIEFIEEIILKDLDKITISASDIYHNVNTLSYKIVRTEISPPSIDLIAPYTSEYNEIFLESESNELSLEGKIADESLIQSILIDGMEAKFINDKKNPAFNAILDIKGKESIKIKAVDAFGNITEKTYKLNRETAQILSSNPMGKTWVVFIDNSEYESFASLDGPSKDISTMRSALAKYDIHHIIEKKNLSKNQMEKFFAIELRDFVKNQRVNSLLVWYAGHGKFVNETGYWIPIDAKRDEEFTYFNVNSLKAFMQSYTNYVTHVLVITDACESGPSFYAAMRGARNRSCNDSIPTRFKSSQVFSSAGYELAADNSPFTKTFAKSLEYNTNSCIPIDNIVNTVTESIGQSGKQSPKFGKIQGLEDEDGTFFFIKKSR